METLVRHTIRGYQNPLPCQAIENMVSRTGFENLKAAGGRCGLKTHGASQKGSGVIKAIMFLMSTSIWQHLYGVKL